VNSYIHQSTYLGGDAPSDVLALPSASLVLGELHQMTTTGASSTSNGAPGITAPSNIASVCGWTHTSSIDSLQHGPDLLLWWGR